MRHLYLPFRVFCVALLLSLLTSSLAKGDDDQIVLIGFSGPLSSAEEAFGKSLLQAAQMAVDEANQRRPMVNGKPARFRLDAQDDRSDVRIATRMAEYFVRAGVVGVIGPTTTNTSVATAGIYHQADIAQLTPSASGRILTRQGYANVFRLIGHDDDVGLHAGQYAAKELNMRRIAIIDDNSLFGRHLADQFTQAAITHGATIVSRHSISNKTSDFNVPLTTIKEQEAELLFFAGYYRQAAELARNMERLKVTARLLSGSNGIVGTGYLHFAGNAANATIGIEMGQPNSSMQGWATFQKNYTAKYGPYIDLYAPYAYDATQVLIAAVLAANTTNPKRVTVALHNIQFQGLTGPIGFNVEGDLKQPIFTIHEVQQQKWRLKKIINAQ